MRWANPQVWCLRNGERWRYDSQWTTGDELTAFTYPFPQGSVRFELVEEGRIKVEVFPGKSIDEVYGFTENAQFYVR